jgi:proteasome lid subunit RPN8/RPN11
VRAAPFELPRAAVNRLLAAAQASPGVEVCGFVVRTADGCEVRQVANVSGNPERQFEMEPHGMIETFRRVRDDGEEILAIYHSHPAGPSRPSALDQQLAYYPELPYLVISLGTRGVLELRAFHLDQGDCRELPLALSDDPGD